MPSHTTHSALIQMYYDGDGAPWTFRRWQEICGVIHGLFPDDDNLLPAGFTRSNAQFIASYFDQYNKKPKEDDKIKFSAARTGADSVPGRDYWRLWVTDLWKVAKLHARITEVLSRENLHPLTLALNSKTGSIDIRPNAMHVLPLAVDAVGKALFGEDSFDRLGRVKMELRPTTQALITRTWLNLSNQITRSKSRIDKLKGEATQAFESKSFFCFPLRPSY